MTHFRVWPTCLTNCTKISSSVYQHTVVNTPEPAKATLGPETDDNNLQTADYAELEPETQ